MWRKCECVGCGDLPCTVPCRVAQLPGRVSALACGWQVWREACLSALRRAALPLGARLVACSTAESPRIPDVLSPPRLASTLLINVLAK